MVSQPKHRTSSSGSQKRERSPGLLLRGVLGAFSLILIWLVVTRSMVSALVSSSPQLALQIRPNYPAALAALAETALDARTAGEASVNKTGMPAPRAEAAATDLSDAQATLISSAAVAGDPLDARAIRVLAQFVDAAGDQQRAAALYGVSARLSVRESFAVYWLLKQAADANDYRSVAVHADTLLRTNTVAEREAVAILARVAERPNGLVAVSELLAQSPPWRVNFFNAVTASITDARTPLQLLQNLAKTAHPPTDKEVNPYLDFLVSKGFHELAYYTWLQFMPPEQLSGIGLLINGDFLRTSTGSPFDWRFAMGRGAISDVLRRKERPTQNSLYLELGPGRVEFSVRQLLLLSPGNYRVSGETMGKLTGKSGVRWRVGCADAQVLGESEQFNGIFTTWTPFDFSFVVPAEKCRSQYLLLAPDARSASEQLISGKVEFSSLAIKLVAPAR